MFNMIFITQSTDAGRWQWSFGCRLPTMP